MKIEVGFVIVAVVLAAVAVVRASIRTRRWLRKYDAMAGHQLAAQYAVLLKRGRDGSILVVTHEPTRRFIQLRKYIHAPGDYGISFGFPRAPWSEGYYASLQAKLESEGIPFLLQPTNDHPVTEFLLVDCGRDIERAKRLTDIMLFEIFEFPSSTTFRVTAQDISVRDQLVDR